MHHSYLSLLLVIPAAFSQLTVTEPIATTTCTGGQTCEVSWEAGPAAPALATYGNCAIGVWTGGHDQQTLLQLIASNVDVATTSTVQFTVNPSIGPDGDAYFIRIESPIADPQTPPLPYLAFSAHFTLSGMTGTFNASVQAQINGITTAVTGPTSASVVVGTTTQGLTTTGATTTAKTSSTATPTNSGAASTISVGSGFLLSALAAGLALFI